MSHAVYMYASSRRIWNHERALDSVQVHDYITISDHESDVCTTRSDYRQFGIYIYSSSSSSLSQLFRVSHLCLESPLDTISRTSVSHPIASNHIFSGLPLPFLPYLR